MKSILTTFICITMGLWAAAQSNPSDFKAAFKLYNSIDFESYQNSHSAVDSTGDFLRTTDTEWSWLRPVFAVQWQNKAGHFHEVELNRLEAGANITETVQRNQQNNNSGPVVAGEDVFRTRIALGYQYVVPLKKENESDMALYIGLGGTNYYQWVTTKPNISTEFPTSTANVGLRLFLSPRFNWFFSERLFLDVQAQVILTDMRFSFQRDENPAIKLEERTTSTTDFATLPSIFSGRVGFGFKL